MMKIPEWLRNLLHRRVPQFLGAYLGAGLALIPFVGFLVDTYDLPQAFLNAVDFRPAIEARELSAELGQ